ncbi:MAG: NAD(P)-dependent oxidoreductase [Burkholderiales bacterium]|nr:NAD(P)-dependent oxidoreductase [Burkholderiales bacterium]
MKPVIGLIGPGAMGLGITRALLRGGFDVLVRDIDPARDALARAAGAQVHNSPAAIAARADIVISVVVDAAQTDDICFGQHGLAGALAPGGIVVLCSTVGPAYARDLSARLAARDLTLIDAPISGGPARAEAGTMSMMISGPAAALARCEAAFRAMSDKRFVISEAAGDGSTMKLVNNLLAAVNLVAGAEAFALARRAGLDLAKVHEVVMASSGGSWMIGDRLKRVINDDHTVTAAMPILTKDVRLAVEMAHQLDARAALGALAHATLQAGVDMGLADEDDAWVIRTYLTSAANPPAGKH